MNDEWRIDDPTLYLPPETTRDPNWVATMFLSGLLGFGPYAEHLDTLITPQSRDAWGRFTEARAYMQGLTAPGISTGHTRPEGARDVAYVAMLTNTTEGYVLPAETVVDAAAVVSLVWHEGADSWLVTALGEKAPVEELHRPSKSPAPERR